MSQAVSDTRMAQLSGLRNMVMNMDISGLLNFNMIYNPKKWRCEQIWRAIRN